MLSLPPVLLLLYNIFLFVYQAAIRIAALFNPKAKKWIEGRRDILQKIKTTLPHNEKRIWFHCASVGEFEQGRPLIEAIKHQHPEYKILLTFFSPSGFELRKNYEFADYIFYLPMDGRKRSAKFIRMANPSLAVFVKYEFWYYYICNLEKNNIPIALISATFRKEQPFFKWYGGLFREMMRKLSFIFVQDLQSQKLLAEIDISKNVSVTGDTRYDRVFAIAQTAQRFLVIEEWKGNSKLLIAGSTWAADEQLLRHYSEALPSDWKMIIAPHEVNPARIQSVKSTFSNSLLYSELPHKTESTPRVLIIDNIGMLSSLFRYGEIAYIGGGFSKGGIHNTLEPAVFGLPVIFGPEYEKFVEARTLVEHELAFSVNDSPNFQARLQELIGDPALLHRKKLELREFVRQNVGVTNKIMETISPLYL